MATLREPLGILGGGQLAQMLIEASKPLGLGEIAVLDESAGAQSGPAALAGGRIAARSAEFFAHARVVIFENEFVDCDRLAREASGARFHPGLEVIRRLQDKLSQKRTLAELGIASSPYEALEASGSTDAKVNSWLSTLPKRFPQGVVLKWARLGYDGKGVCLLKDLTASGALERAQKFCEQARAKGVEVFAEALVEFRRELAIIGCRSSSGAFTAYPLVESQQRDGICHFVQGPVSDAKLEAKARDFAKRLGDGVGLVGAYALELFETKQGELLVNEIAPRVHNTGHYSQDAADTSQFENHWRGALGMELGSVKTPAAFAMLNLLGPSGLELDVAPEWRPDSPPADSGLFVHWYGKTAVRPGRKLGHVNARASGAQELPELKRRLEAWHATWEAQLRRMKA